MKLLNLLITAKKVGRSFTKYEINTNTAGGKLFLQMLGVLAEFESAQLAERQNTARTERTKRGLKYNGGNALGHIQERTKKFVILLHIRRLPLCTGITNLAISNQHRKILR